MNVRHKTSSVWRETWREYWVYTHIAVDGSVLYVGCTGDRVKRASNHRCRSSWYSQIAETRYEGPFDREAGYDRETELIAALDPPNNVIGTSRRKESLGWRVGQFYLRQIRDEYARSHSGACWSTCGRGCWAVARQAVEARYPRAEVEALLNEQVSVAVA